jgi:hypothetical protein
LPDIIRNFLGIHPPFINRTRRRPLIVDDSIFRSNPIIVFAKGRSLMNDPSTILIGDIRVIQHLVRNP